MATPGRVSSTAGIIVDGKLTDAAKYVRNPMTGAMMRVVREPSDAPGWVMPDWSIGPSGPNGESGPFARPY